MLIVAFSRLWLLPHQADGSKQTTIMSVDRYDLNLIESPNGTAVTHLHRLRIELRNTRTGQVVCGAGCHDLQDAWVATERFMGEAERLASRHENEMTDAAGISGSKRPNRSHSRLG